MWEHEVGGVERTGEGGHDEDLRKRQSIVGMRVFRVWQRRWCACVWRACVHECVCRTCRYVCGLVVLCLSQCHLGQRRQLGCHWRGCPGACDARGSQLGVPAAAQGLGTGWWVRREAGASDLTDGRDNTSSHARARTVALTAVGPSCPRSTCSLTGRCSSP